MSNSGSSEHKLPKPARRNVEDNNDVARLHDSSQWFSQGGIMNRCVIFPIHQGERLIGDDDGQFR